MQLVVPRAVAAAVMAATITFNSTSQNRLFFINSYILHLTSYILKMLGPQPLDISPQPSYISHR